MKKKISSKKPSGYKLTEVVSVVSHQLKTPLSAIKGYLEVLLSEDLGELNEKQEEYLKDVLENTRQMIGLIIDLLDVTRIEADKVEFNPQSINLANIVKESLKDFNLLARAKNCKLSLTISNNLPPLNIDPIKIKQVIDNIISNAILYNKRKGKVEISLSKKGKNIIFCCKDTGIGISEEEKNKIFTKFYRSEQAVSLTTRGSGLGLFISKAIIEKNKGKIWFNSEKEKGTTFCFSLPLK